MQNPSLFRIESNLELHDLEYNDDSLSLSSIFSEYSFGSESLEHLQSVANDIYALENGEELKQEEEDPADQSSCEDEGIPDLGNGLRNHLVRHEPVNISEP